MCIIKKPIVKLSKSIAFQKNNGSNIKFCIEFVKTSIETTNAFAIDFTANI